MSCSAECLLLAKVRRRRHGYRSADSNRKPDIRLGAPVRSRVLTDHGPTTDVGSRRATGAFLTLYGHTIHQLRPLIRAERAMVSSASLAGARACLIPNR